MKQELIAEQVTDNVCQIGVPPKKDSVDHLIAGLWLIKQKDPDVFEAIEENINLVVRSFDQQYADEEMTEFIDTRALLTSNSALSIGANFHAILKYIKRLFSVGYQKSQNVIDAYKSVHFIWFFVARIKKYGKIENVQIKYKPTNQPE